MPPEDQRPTGRGPTASQDQVLFGGLLAACVGFLAQFSDKTPERFSCLWLASVCFAVAMPALSTSLLLDMARSAAAPKPVWRLLFDFLGVLASVAAVALIFLSVNPWAGYTFFGTALLAIVLVARGPKA